MAYDFNVENTDVASGTVPAGVTGCWVTLQGGGGAGGQGHAATTAAQKGGGGGGGGGGRVSRVWIPAASLGSTYSLTRGQGGASSAAAGGNSTFVSGSTSLAANGGGGGTNGTTSNVTGGAGGTASSSNNGFTATTLTGGAGAPGYIYTSGAPPDAADIATGAAAGGGGGGACSAAINNQTAGSDGGNSSTVTGGAGGAGNASGTAAAAAAMGFAGAGGGGAGGTQTNTSRIGGAGGAWGAGGGGGGGKGGNTSNAAGGAGAAGYTLVEWIGAAGVMYVSSAAAATTTVTMPAHVTGDLIVVFTYRDGSTTAPTLASGFTDVSTRTGATCSARVAYKFATSGSETTGTWTSATGIVVQVYRGCLGIRALSLSNAIGTGTTIGYPALTMTVTDNTSWVARFAGASAVTNMLTNAVAGYTQRAGVATEIRGLDTNGTVSTNQALANQTITASSNWIAYTVELFGVSAVTGASLVTDNFNTGSVPDSGKWTTGGTTTPTLSGGSLSCHAVASAGSGTSIASGFGMNYNFSNDAVYVQVGSMSFTGTALFPNAIFGVVGIAVGLAAYWQFNMQAGVATPNVVGTGNGTGVTHVPGILYRVRESSGTTYLDYSTTNGSSWVNQYSGVTPIGMLRGGVQISSANNYLFVGDFGSTATASFDNYNLIPSVSSGNFFQMFN